VPELYPERQMKGEELVLINFVARVEVCKVERDSSNSPGSF